MIDIKTVTVIGANGSMGSKVAAIFASFGDAKVYLISRNIQDSQAAINVAAKSVKADVIKNNLIPCDYSSLDLCLRESDFIFESVSENLSVKESVYRQMCCLKEGAIIATGTSGLSINKIKNFLPKQHQSNFYGVHFFNPPYSMPLCELIENNCSNKDLTDNIRSYLTQKLLRKVVVSKDEPAFIGNRIGFYFINFAMLLAEKYKNEGGIDFIDSIFGCFTGRNMPPLVTADFVGLDVYKAIVQNLYDNTDDFQNQYYLTPDYANFLIESNSLGRKSGKGLYRTFINENGIKQRQVYDIITGNYREIRKYNFDFADKMVTLIKSGDYIDAVNVLISDNTLPCKICRELLLKYIVYSLFVASEVSDSVHSADIVMAEGFNWIPPLALIEMFGGKSSVINMIEKDYKEDFKNIDFINIISSAEKSNYDYRRFLKAKR